MRKRLPRAGFWIRAAAVAVLPSVGVATLVAGPLGAAGIHASKRAAEPQRPAVRATVAPDITIPVEPLGFTAPGEFYLGARYAMVSLDFLDEDRLLFTFRVPGLIHREPTGTDQARRIHAVVLKLPEGTVESDAIWTLHDRARYLFPLDNGKFLLRDQDSLLTGDASLELKPFLRFPGPVLWAQVDPTRQFIVAGSSEPVSNKERSDEDGSDSAAASPASPDQPEGRRAPDLVVRILRRDTGKVMLVSRVRNQVHVPINADGYLEPLHGDGSAWVLNFNDFGGGSRIVGKVDSICSPVVDFVSSREFLATTCGNTGDPKLVALSVNGQRLWETTPTEPMVWPLLISNAAGTRVARETLVASHGVNAAAPLGTDDIKGQDVQVFDAATGRVVLRAAASPIFDAGGNVAISPTGQRVAIVMDSKIQVFDLPAPPPVPDPSLQKARR